MINSALYDDVVDRIHSIYSSCSYTEQQQLLQILREISIYGDSETLEHLWLADFKEVPVSIDKFISDPGYMGNATNCGKSIYPYWRGMFNEVFGAGNKYNEIVLSGSTRIGKTHSMIFILSYMLYRLMMYRDPRAYFKKSPTTRFYIAFANLTKDLASGVAYRTFNDTLHDCEWFQKHGRFSRSERNYYYIPEGDKIDIIAGSDSAHMLGLALWAVGIDECNFAKAGIKDINKAKEHMKKLYDTVNARISGSFRLHGEVYGKMVTASSKNTDSDFLSDHIEKQLSAGNQSLYLVDEPQWKILPPEMFSGKTFYFTVGDRFKKGFVVPDENCDDAHLREYEAQGYEVVEAPLELKKNFIADYDISLRDIAGRSVVGAMGFITQDMVTPCVSQDRKNPFFTDIIEIGSKDRLSIEEFFHKDVVPKALFYQQLNIHLDLSETGDKTGLAGTCVDGNKIVEDYDGKKVSRPFLKEIFSVSLKAPRGDRLSFQKVVNFIVWLRRAGFNVGTISTDQYQSSYLREVLSQQGFNTTKISVDTSMEPYIALRGMLNDQCIELVRNQLQEDELVGLQRINNKIDHKINASKDVSDALCGSAWTLLTEDVKTQVPSHSIAKVTAAVNRMNTRANPYDQLGRLMGNQFSPIRNR